MSRSNRAAAQLLSIALFLVAGLFGAGACSSPDGGLSAACVADGVAEVLPLPVAGLMATGTCEEVGHAYGKLDKLVKQWGSPLRAPYMTLSFMALLVIPALKLSDRGLFDGAKFEFTDLLR